MQLMSEMTDPAINTAWPALTRGKCLDAAYASALSTSAVLAQSGWDTCRSGIGSNGEGSEVEHSVALRRYHGDTLGGIGYQETMSASYFFQVANQQDISRVPQVLSSLLN